ncbi:MAG: hypothetical protein AB8B94_20710, partial [Hyphomicrobiales bacterium]
SVFLSDTVKICDCVHTGLLNCAATVVANVTLIGKVLCGYFVQAAKRLPQGRQYRVLGWVYHVHSGIGFPFLPTAGAAFLDRWASRSAIRAIYAAIAR